MPRVKRGAKRRERRKKLLSLAKGYFLGKSKLYRFAKEAVDRAGNFAYVGRKRKKRDFRRLWIVRINAATRAHDMSYSVFMAGLKRAGVDLDRKSLADLAARDPQGFTKLVESAKAATAARPAPSSAAEERGAGPRSGRGARAASRLMSGSPDDLEARVAGPPRGLRAEARRGARGRGPAGPARRFSRPQVGSGVEPAQDPGQAGGRDAGATPGRC